MAINQIAELAQARQAQAAQRGSNSTLPLEDLPVLTQEFVAWYKEDNGDLVNANYKQINAALRTGSNKAKRHTGRAVERLLYSGIAFDDIEPLIKEGIFIYTQEQIMPTTVSGTAKPIQTAEQYMLDYFYSVKLIRA